MDQMGEDNKDEGGEEDLSASAYYESESADRKPESQGGDAAQGVGAGAGAGAGGQSGGLGNNPAKAKAHKVAKTTKTKAKHNRSKKPDDMPKRPLSAYNIFFKEQRAMLLASTRTAAAEAPVSKESAVGVEGSVASIGIAGVGPEDAACATAGQVSGDSSKLGFESMARTIAKRWRELRPDQLEPYKHQANLDTERYRREMEEYQNELVRRSRQEREKATAAAAAAASVQVRNEAMPPQQYHSAAPSLFAKDPTKQAQAPIQPQSMIMNQPVGVGVGLPPHAANPSISNQYNASQQPLGLPEQLLAALSNQPQPPQPPPPPQGSSEYASSVLAQLSAILQGGSAVDGNPLQPHGLTTAADVQQQYLYQQQQQLQQQQQQQQQQLQDQQGLLSNMLHLAVLQQLLGNQGGGHSSSGGGGAGGGQEGDGSGGTSDQPTDSQEPPWRPDDSRGGT